MQTRRLYYTDPYLKRFDAEVVKVKPAASGFHAYLNQTAFYPASGGQPFDLGRIAGAAVVDVIDEEERIAHVVDGPLEPGPVACEIDWTRRFDHMQQHTGQHLLSAVFVELFGYPTVSFHLGSDVSTIDLAAADVTAAQIAAAEERANALVFENRPVSIRFYSPEEAAKAGLRKPSERTGEVRVIDIDALDRSACGGTHVRTTGEIGPILIRRLDRVRQTVRVEFVCGARAVRCARADYNALSEAALGLSAPLDQVPALVRSQMESAKTADKARQKLESELAAYKGKDLYAATPPDARGLRLHQVTERSGALEPWRLLAQSFTSAGPGAVFLVTVDDPPAMLVAVSQDVKAQAGELVKAATQAFGGRGGGNPRLAQGSLPHAEAARKALDRVVQELRK